MTRPVGVWRSNADESLDAATAWEHGSLRLYFWPEDSGEAAVYLFLDLATGYASCYTGPQDEVVPALRESFSGHRWRLVSGGPQGEAAGLWRNGVIPPNG